MSETGSAIIIAACMVIFYLSITHLADNCHEDCQAGAAAFGKAALPMVILGTGLAFPLWVGYFVSNLFRSPKGFLATPPAFALVWAAGMVPTFVMLLAAMVGMCALAMIAMREKPAEPDSKQEAAASRIGLQSKPAATERPYSDQEVARGQD